MASKEYDNGEITVVWNPSICTHSGNCVKGSPKVFKPKEKPWIKMEAETSKSIMKTINTCPSGALSFYKNKK
ncbi:(4Fe-4S)-binding protein [Ascidiimonas sp. W6]|uniref:(4Fe-4S)-binding protein n=1 Tax=Ascidiimonas meishanensis TaxID=3128903 RepID=UPI0030EF1886